MTQEWRAEYAKGPDGWDMNVVMNGLADAILRVVPEGFTGYVVFNFEAIPLDLSHPDFADFALGRDAWRYHECAVYFFPETCRLARRLRPTIGGVGWYGLLPKFSIDEPAKAERAKASIRKMQWLYSRQDGPNAVMSNNYADAPPEEGQPDVGVQIGPRLEAVLETHVEVAQRASRARGKTVWYCPYISSNFRGDQTLKHRMTPEEFKRYGSQVRRYAAQAVHFGGPGTREDEMTAHDFAEHLEMVVKPVLPEMTLVGNKS